MSKRLHPEKETLKIPEGTFPTPPPPMCSAELSRATPLGGGRRLALWWCSCFWVTHTLVSNAPIKIHWFTKSDSGSHFFCLSWISFRGEQVNSHMCMCLFNIGKSGTRQTELNPSSPVRLKSHQLNAPPHPTTPPFLSTPGATERPGWSRAHLSRCGEWEQSTNSKFRFQSSVFFQNKDHTLFRDNLHKSYKK